MAVKGYGMKASETNKTEACEIHGGHSHKANTALLVMFFGSLLLIVLHVWAYGPTAHLSESATASRSFAQLVGSEIWDILFNKRGIIAELWEVFPYFLAGIFIAGYLRTYKVAVKLNASLRKYGVLSVFFASFIGVITPLCACGTVTTAISLLFAGLPLAPVMSLMITSSLLSPSTYLITLNDLGAEWTVIRTIASLFMGIFAGLLTHFLSTRGFETKAVFIEGAITKGDFHDEDYPDERLRCNCKQKFGNRVAIRTSNKFLILLAKSSEMIWMVGKYIIIGVSMGAIVERYMPTDWIYRFFGQKDPLNIIWVTLVSVPMFLHQLSASSILAHIKGSLGGTLDSGAALAFMVGGPVTAVPTMVLFWTIFKKRVFFLYLSICLVGTFIISYAFQVFVFVPGVDTGNELLRGLDSIPGGNSAVISKSDRNVRMVVDPDEKGLIATFRNDIGGQGGVVFDSGFGRFLENQTDSEANRQYIENVARWLEQNSNSQGKSNILIYNLSDENVVPLSGKVLSRLASNGFKVHITDRAETPALTEKMLSNHGQLWLFSGNQSRLSVPESKTISRFVDNGNGMFLVAGGDFRTANLLSARYGVAFSVNTENRGPIPLGISSIMFGDASEALGNLLRLVKKA